MNINGVKREDEYRGAGISRASSRVYNYRLLCATQRTEIRLLKCSNEIITRKCQPESEVTTVSALFVSPYYNELVGQAAITNSSYDNVHYPRSIETRGTERELGQQKGRGGNDRYGMRDAVTNATAGTR